MGAVPGPRGTGHLLRSAGITAGPAVPGRGFRRVLLRDNGRDSVPPSLLATALLLQSHDKVSDAEAGPGRATSTSAGRWPLGIEVEDRPFAKSTLQVFRAQLILHDRVREVFESKPAAGPGSRGT